MTQVARSAVDDAVAAVQDPALRAQPLRVKPLRAQPLRVPAQQGSAQDGPAARAVAREKGTGLNGDRISRRQIDKFAERRAQLAESALLTLSELGYARTSLREIAQNSEFSHGVLHYYFRDKVDLITHCVREYKARCVTRYEVDRAGKPWRVVTREPEVNQPEVEPKAYCADQTRAESDISGVK